MAARQLIAIEIGRRQLRALQASGRKDGLEVERSLCADYPEDLDLGDPDGLSSWVGETLRDSGIDVGRATVVLAREHVALKRLTLPSIVADELPEMTRLALQRDLPFDAADAVIDFVPMEQDERSTTVLAVAAPNDACASARAVVERAGWKVDRIALRTMGTLALLRTQPEMEDVDNSAGSPRLAVDVTRGGVEFTVVDRDGIRFARAADTANGSTPTSPGGIAEAVRTEARRTWMSYRIADGSSDVVETVVLGDRDLVGDAADALAEMLKGPAGVLQAHPRIAVNGERVDRVWPLAGLLLESVIGNETIDFVHPRKAANRQGDLRRRGLLVGGLVAVLFMLGGVLSQRLLADLEDEIAEAKSEFSDILPAHARYERERFRLEHLKRWTEMSPAWMAHLRHLDSMLPGTDSLVLDGWTGTMGRDGVRYDDKAKGDAAWSVPVQLTLIIEGEARDRSIAGALRDALVEPAWMTVESTGSEIAGGKRHEHGFTYRVDVNAAEPPS